MSTNNTQPSFDFVKSVTKKNGVNQKSSFGIWIWMGIGLFLCLLAVLLSMYLAVIGLVIALIAMSNGHDQFKSSFQGKFAYASQIVISSACLLLLLLSLLVESLGR
jgi:multisubunit Na+/H+ antiporter MnhB subunit